MTTSSPTSKKIKWWDWDEEKIFMNLEKAVQR